VERSQAAQVPGSTAIDRAGDHTSTEAVIQNLFIGEAISSAGYVILVADEHMRYLAATDAAGELLGYSQEELRALHLRDIVVETNVSELFEQFMDDGAQRGTITLRRKDGSHVAATYDARVTRVSQLTYYVSWLTPLKG
jgi:PAS domain S-box-containing protein